MNFLRVATIFSLALLAGCTVTVSEYRPDRVQLARLEPIKTVAVVGYSIPWRVGLGKESNNPSTVPPFMRKGGKYLANGPEISPAVLAGFMDEAAKSPRFTFMKTEDVTKNTAYAALMEKYDQSAKLAYDVSGVPGIAVVPLRHGVKTLEFAQKAAAALGVDGVMVVTFSQLYYDLYVGATGSGKAHARTYATLNLFDKNGQSVWAGYAGVNSEAKAPMALGVLTGGHDELHKSAGSTAAADALKAFYPQEAAVAK